VAAVRTIDMVVDTEQERLPDGGSFLSDRQVGRSAVIVLDTLIVTAELHFVEHVLEVADDHHVALNADQIILGEAGHFLFDGLLVLVDRNGFELDKRRFANLVRDDHLPLRHGT